jgi:uncharacterized protein with ParB-like and HNH nuclease domain
MEPKTLEIFFTGKSFSIPSYQRAYAWEKENINDLYEDIQEAIDTNTSHYIGTFILSKKQGEEIYKVVDGQQRLTTLIMILHSLIKHLGKKQKNIKIVYNNLFIRSNNTWKLNLLGKNRIFFPKLLNDKNPKIEDKGQRLLTEAYDHIKNRVDSLRGQREDNLLLWLETIKQLQVLEFVEPDEGKAIRIFQTVNDRGIDLTYMEKVKSLLIYYSNRFLDGSLDQKINEIFGHAFQAFSSIKEIAEDEDYQIQLIKQMTFTEDSIIRYHFLGFNSEKHDFTATTAFVLDKFLKPTLKEYRNNGNELHEFINKYIEDLQLFFAKLLNILQRMKTDKKYYKLFSTLNLSALLYPLVIRLEARGLLDQPVPDNPAMKFIDLIEITDVRVYKTRGTDPAKDISILARDATQATPEEISTRLLGIVSYFMNDREFRSRLEQDIYGNQALSHIFIEYDEKLLKGRGYNINKLISHNKSKPTVEHIFSEEPTFSFPSRGFNSDEDYRAKIHKLGNLTLLSKSLNSRCSNKTVEDKVNDPNLYMRSTFKITQKFLADIQNQGGTFNSADIDKRTKTLANFCLRRWPLWR